MRYLLLAATALALVHGAANAQTSSSGSNSNSTAINASKSQSSSVSNPRVNVIGNPIGNGASSSTSGATSSSSTRSSSRSSAIGNSSTNTTSTTINVSGYAGVDGGSGSGASGATGTTGTSGSGTATNEQTLNYGGSYTVRNTPEVSAPSIVGGNACAVGASGGLALPGFGLAMGATWADRACERRQQAALLFNMGEQKVAYELMCQDENVRSAMRTAGKPCIADAKVAEAAPAAPVAAVAAAPASAVKVASLQPIAPAPKPEWCSRAVPSTEASKAYFMQVCR